MSLAKYRVLEGSHWVRQQSQREKDLGGGLDSLMGERRVEIATKAGGDKWRRRKGTDGVCIS